MKVFVTLALILLVVNSSLQIPQLKNCASDFLEKNPSAADDCGIVTCHDDNTITETSCGSWRCLPGEQIGYTEADNSKAYPACCAGPICKPQNEQI